MTEADLFDLIDPVLTGAGAVVDDGEEFRLPPLDILRYYRRPVRLHWVPWVGQGLSVVAIVRQSVDIGFSADGYRTLLTRLAMAANGRFPPWGSGTHPKGLVLGLTALVLTPEPIGPDDDTVLGTVVSGRPLPRQRAVPLGVLRVNLGQEALAFSLASGPEGVFTEPLLLADALTPKLKRFVPLMDAFDA